MRTIVLSMSMLTMIFARGPLQVSFSVYLAVRSACSLVSCFLPCAMISRKKWIQVHLITARTRYTVSSAISTSFDDLTPTVMKSKVNWTMLFTSIAILAFVCLHACLMIGINPKARKYAKAKPCSDAAQEKACEYCGYTYVVDTCTECPHCGAPIPPEDQPGARFT